MDVGHPMTSMAAMRSFRRDPSVTARELPKGTVRRILGIARPYRKELVFFLALVVGSSLIGVITPLLAGDIINRIASLEGTAGDIFVIKAGEIHEFKNVGEGPLVQVDVHLSPRFIQENL